MGWRWFKPWPGHGPWSWLPPWERPGWWFGRGWCWWWLLYKDPAVLEEYKKFLEEELEYIKRRIEDLKKKSGEGT